MADNNVTDYPRALHPLHAILLAFPLPLFLGALLSDLAYSSTYEVQWTNFASWLIAGAMLTVLDWTLGVALFGKTPTAVLLEQQSTFSQRGVCKKYASQ